MEELRELIQSEFNKLDNVDCGIAIPDGMVESHKNYFGYELQETFISGDLDGSYLMEVSLTGRLVRRNDTEEDSLKEIYGALESLKQALKNLNFKYSYNDINLDDNFKKVLVKANARYYETNNDLVR